MRAAVSPADSPALPSKRYFTIGEAAQLCGVKPHVLRYWEQEFTQIKPIKRRGNRRYYQHEDVAVVRQIRALLYEQGFTIPGARLRLADMKPLKHLGPQDVSQLVADLEDVIKLLS